MWSITNNTPFAAERAWVRDKNGAEVWLVAVRGTFLIGPDGTMQLAEEQSEVCLPPKYRGDPAETSLLYESDLVHKKLSTDVLLDGHAYAPEGTPTTQVDVTLKVANIDKTVRVIGDRVWQGTKLGLVLSKPEPFTKMPLIYERAFGGTDQLAKNPEDHDWERRNPVGVGFAKQKAHLVGKPAPNLEDPSALINHWKSRPKPIGFGPIAGHWTPRIDYAGTYDEKWEKNTQPLLPEDFDERFHQSAPEDQQVPFLKGGELVELCNLTPDGILRFRLPRVTLGFETVFDNADNERHRSFLHTVLLEPDVPQVTMVWHTHLPCHHKVLKLSDTDIFLKQQRNISEHDRTAGIWVGESHNP